MKIIILKPNKNYEGYIEQTEDLRSLRIEEDGAGEEVLLINDTMRLLYDLNEVLYCSDITLILKEVKEND